MFSKRIKELRLINDMTQADLARKLGISPSAVGMYEQGRRTPDSEMLKYISNVFGVSVDHLLGNNTQDGSKSKDLAKYIDKFTDEVMNQQYLEFDGKPLRRAQLEKIIEGMKLGMLLALKQSEKE